jgi:hypothetical protein
MTDYNYVGVANASFNELSRTFPEDIGKSQKRYDSRSPHRASKSRPLEYEGKLTTTLQHSVMDINMKRKSCPCDFFTEHHAMKAYWRSGRIAPRTPDLGTRWR